MKIVSFFFSVVLFTLTLFFYALPASSTEKTVPPPHPINKETISASKPPRQKKTNSFASGDFIFWTARTDGLTYAQTGRNDLDTLINSDFNSLVNLPQGSDSSVKWKWDPGFKVAVGWDFSEICWQAKLEYTWFYTKATNSKTSNDTMQPSFEVFPLNIISTLDPITFAAGTWYLHYHLLNFELGRYYNLTKKFKIHPFMGAIATTQKQQYNCFFDSSTFSASFLTTTIPALGFNSRNHQTIYGIGLQTGLHAFFDFAKVSVQLGMTVDN